MTTAVQTVSSNDQLFLPSLSSPTATANLKLETSNFNFKSYARSKYPNSKSVRGYRTSRIMDHLSKPYHLRSRCPSINSNDLSAASGGSHGFHSYINKFHDHKSKSIEKVKLFYSNRRRLNRGKSTGYKKDDSNDNFKDGNYTDKLNDFSDYVKNFPEEAFSCYNQYKTENFGKLFDLFDSDSYSSSKGLSISLIELPNFSPVNELDYENLQTLRNQVFSLPPFSADLDIDRIPSIYSNCSSDHNENNTETTIGDVNELSEHPLSSVSLGLMSNFEDDENNSDIKTSTPTESIETIEPSTAERNSGNSDPQKMSAASTALSGNSAADTPDLISKIVNDSIKTGEEFVINSTELKVIEEELLENSKDEESILTVIQPAYSPSLSYDDDKEVEETEDDDEEEEEYKPRSILDKVKQVLKVDEEDCEDYEEGDYSYDPISVTVPTLRNHDMILDIAENISEGIEIDDILETASIYSELSEDDENDDNRLINIKDPKVFDIPSLKSNGTDTYNNSCDNKIRIKFDKFSQLLVYDGSINSSARMLSNNSLKRKSINNIPVDNTTITTANNNSKNNKSKRRRISKNNGTIDLEFSFSFEEKVYNENSKLKPKPILKNGYNSNREIETIKANKCDFISIKEFMDFFEKHEIERMETGYQFLEEARQNQLEKYYYEVKMDVLNKAFNISTSEAPAETAN